MLAHTRLGRPVECTKSVEDGGPFHYTRSLNVPIQGSCAEALLEALAALPEAITDLDAAPALCVHDEIILSVAETDAEAALYVSMVNGTPQGGVYFIKFAPLLANIYLHYTLGAVLD